jgi:lipopolysaccharide export system protein LptC
MTDSFLIPNQSRLAPIAMADKVRAFEKARRHSRRVRWLRRIILFGAVAVCAGLVVFVFFDPFRAVIPANVAIDGAGLDGSRVTMNRPRMSGFRKDGRPYDFIAKTAVQDLKVPNVLELNALDAHVTMADKSVAHVTADQGIYDSSQELMDLKGNIRITSDAGFDVRMSVAHIEFKAGDVASDAPVNVSMKTGTVAADTMRMTGNGSEVSFTGHVHSLMLPASAEPRPGAEVAQANAPSDRP